MEAKRLKRNIILGVSLGLLAVLIDIHLVPGGFY